MPKTAVITARVEPELKKEAEEVISQVGLTMSQAMTLYLRQIVNRRAIPFELRAEKPGNSAQFLRSLAGIVHSGHSDTSERVDELVAESILQRYQQEESA
jgi:DNA-damage-inducible protein J